ncbi:enoyl-CoA hydratase [Actinokineospora bangkokensis]|uniref:Enoyl-CoA hydratase n=1 Tax=Actinokineospora bangkokensis TaxID=1193682 RepID=A0A1Q9LF76_9PSEU|nr:enoyl-CoA hydratase [Actinokineospora bangkokensis]OLR90686.1 enoyl-CoA hydratase [Actinokineospora bangkokensis]
MDGSTETAALESAALESAVLLDKRDGVAVLTLNDPGRRNALTLASSARLAELVGRCEQDPEVHALVVTGAPPAFCAGADLTVLGESKAEGLRGIYAGFLAVAGCSLPTIAAVGGAAVGAGLNLALAADVRICGPGARFDARFLQLGIHPGGGMTWMLQRFVTPQVATAMTLFKHVPGAAEAERVGLSLRTVDGDHDALVAAAVELAAPAAKGPRELVRSIKRTLRGTEHETEHARAVEAELAVQVESMGTPEFAELLAAMKARISGSA